MVQETLRLEGGIVTTVGAGAQSDITLFFDSLTDHTVSIQNSVTDNYLENNTAIQDCIAQNPITVSVKGISGELVYTPPNFTLSNLYYLINSELGNKTGLWNPPQWFQEKFKNHFDMNNTPYWYVAKTDKLKIIPELLPPVDNITQRAKNAVQYAEASVERYLKIANNFLKPLNNQTRLQQIYESLLSLRNNNTLFVVATPYKTFANMAVTSITLSQGNVNHITDIQMDFKQINYAETQTTKPDEKTKAWYNAVARTELANHGPTTGENVDINTLLAGIFNVPANKGVRRN